MTIRAIIIIAVGIVAAATFCRNEIYNWIQKYIINNKENEDE